MAILWIVYALSWPIKGPRGDEPDGGLILKLFMSPLSDFLSIFTVLLVDAATLGPIHLIFLQSDNKVVKQDNDITYIGIVFFFFA